MLDTNVYRDGAYAEAVRRIRRIVVSGVVVQELLVIASREQQVALIASFREKLAQREANVPDADDWCEVGKCLYRLSSEGFVNFGKLSKGEVNLLVRDALIARSAMELEAVLVTSNTDDFSKIKRVFRSLQYKSPSEFFGTRAR